MNHPKSIREGLAAAACALIGVVTPGAVDATEIDASMLYYTEGFRVSVNEGVFNVRKPLGNDRYLGINFAYDLMTGASPNGAVKSSKTQTFTRPSGAGGYVILPEMVPLDDTFQDNRAALSANLETPLGRAGWASFGAHFSIEYDYLSTGPNVRFSRDFFKRNTTLAAGAAYSRDTLSPQGGSPVAFSPMLPPGETPIRQNRIEHKNVYDLLIGITQVINRTTLARVNYTLSHAGGYNTDPYKVLTVAETTAGPDEGDPVDYLHEHRPDSRTRHSVYGILKHHFARDVAEASYRFSRDDWGIESHTAEMRYRITLKGRRYLQPQIRWYSQRGADFFRYFLRDGDPLPDYASADYRIGDFDAITVAAKYGIAVADVHEVNVRIGYYLQMGDSSPPQAFGNLRNVDLFPDVEAYILQIAYSATLE